MRLRSACIAREHIADRVRIGMLALRDPAETDQHEQGGRERPRRVAQGGAQPMPRLGVAHASILARRQRAIGHESGEQRRCAHHHPQ